MSSKADVVQHVLPSFIFEGKRIMKFKGPQHAWSCHVLWVDIQHRKVTYNFLTLRICRTEMSMAARVNERMMKWVILINESRICLVKRSQTGFMPMLLMSGLFLHRRQGRISSSLLYSFCSPLPPGSGRKIRGVGEQHTVPCTSDLQLSRQLPAPAPH